VDRPRTLLELTCPECRWSEGCDPAQAVDWLRKAGKVRSRHEPEADVLVELLRAAGAALCCPACAHKGLAVGPPPEDLTDWPDKPCSACSRPIGHERLEALPDATLCAECQKKIESGGEAGPTEYCPRCGSPMRLRLSRSAGISHYEMVCTAVPPCRG
jgi:hypothetical protein